MRKSSRPGKRERAAALARKARIWRTLGGIASVQYVNQWTNMRPHGKPRVPWEWHGRNAPRIAKRALTF